MVPGSIVERITTKWWLFLRAATAAPISSQTRRDAARSSDAVAPRGRADANQAQLAGRHRFSRRQGRPQATRRHGGGDEPANVRFSMIGLLPAFTRSTLASLTSHPITSFPRSAKQAAQTAPT